MSGLGVPELLICLVVLVVVVLGSIIAIPIILLRRR
jgi:hypothetical protein